MAFFIIAVLLTSCFANQTRVQRYSKVEKSLMQGDLEASLSIVSDQKAYSKKDLLLFLMDNGILNFYGGNTKDAFRFLDQADRYQEDLYTQSITANVSTYLINDNQRPYAGEDFEVLYLNTLKALSFIQEKDPEGAMVEVRQGINKLSVFEIRYQKQLDKLKGNTPPEFKNPNDNSLSYSSNLGKYDLADSALLRLMSLILNRDDGKDDVAEIDKKKIKEIWRLYPDIYNFEKIDLDKINYIKPKDKVVLDVFAFSGMTAKKLPWNLDVVTTNGVMSITSNTPGRSFSTFIPFYGRVGSFSISIPYMVRRNNRIRKAELFINDKKYSSLNIVENTSNIALNQFNKQKNFIIMKSLIRATAKAVATYKLQDEARKKREKGEDNTALAVAGVFSSVFASATEVADIRSWNTLPDNCYFGEVVLPEGEYKLDIHYLDSGNRIVRTYSENVSLKKKNKNNLIVSYAL